MDAVFGDDSRCEMDSHADTTVCGANFVNIGSTGETVEVSPFSTEYESIPDIPIASCATAYDCPRTGETIILVFNEAMYFGSRMGTSLLCPNQIRDFGHGVHDIPRQFELTSTHSIDIKEYGADTDDNIALKLNGVISYFDSRLPTDQELLECRRIIMTDDDHWNPRADKFEINERALEQSIERPKGRWAERLKRAKSVATCRHVSSLGIARDNDLHQRLLDTNLFSSNIGDAAKPQIVETIDETEDD